MSLPSKNVILYFVMKENVLHTFHWNIVISEVKGIKHIQTEQNRLAMEGISNVVVILHFISILKITQAESECSTYVKQPGSRRQPGLIGPGALSDIHRRRLF